jgi:hypothetical protein
MLPDAPAALCDTGLRLVIRRWAFATAFRSALHFRNVSQNTHPRV